MPGDPAGTRCMFREPALLKRHYRGTPLGVWKLWTTRLTVDGTRRSGVKKSLSPWEPWLRD